MSYYDESFYEFLPFFLLIIGVYGVLFVGMLVSYILNGIGIMRMSKALGVPNGWLGFIPYGKEYQLGRLGGEIEFGKKAMRKPGIWLAVLPLLSGGVFGAFYGSSLFSMIMRMESYYYYDTPPVSVFTGFFTSVMIGYIALLVGSIFTILIRGLVLNRVFGYFYEGQKPIFYLLLSLFVPFAQAILFMKSAKEPVQSPPTYWPGGYYPQSEVPYSQRYEPQPYGGQPPYPQAGQPYGEQPPYPQAGQPYGEQPPYPQAGQPYGEQPPYPGSEQPREQAPQAPEVQPSPESWQNPPTPPANPAEPTPGSDDNRPDGF